MKSSSLFAAIICSFLFLNQSKAQESFSPDPAKAIEVNANRSNLNDKVNHDDWFNEAIENIKRMEYDFYALNAFRYKVANPKNHLAFILGPTSYTVESSRSSNNEKSWKLHFELAGYGRKTFNQPGTVSSVTRKDNLLVYQFPSLNIEYDNSEAGLRQNFEIKQKPSGTGALSIKLQVSGELSGKMAEAGKIGFYDNQGKLKMIYEDLKAWDALKRPLKTHLEFDEKNQQINLVVDDTNAAYPILVDPLNKTPEWSTSVNGVISSLLTQTQLQAALYGYTVTGLGDVNGDGYGDAAISAPALVDIFSGSGTLTSVGAVFIFYGSPNGLSTVPAKTLQPNTAVAGALFGLSVDAGDVTGDGINDIVIGAPLDRIQLGAGINTIQGTVGKVYIYNGGSNNISNPTPFLSIQLNTSNISAVNISVNALFGFSVAVTEDLNKDGKKDIIVGSPAYAAIPGLLAPLVQTGGAFVFLSGQGNNNFTTIRSLTPPTFNILGINIPLINSINGLLFGYSVDGVGDYNGDNIPDVVVGAPAGVNLSGLTGILTGQVLGGQALVYYGNGNANGINTSIGARLQAAPTGLLSNAANLFGFKVKGVKGANLERNGNIVIGAPVGGLISNTLSLTIQTGNVHVFKKKASSPGSVVTADQVLESPKSTHLLQLLSTLKLNVLFGAGIDNAYDINCDGYPDLVVGEPLSSGTNILQLQANAAGGAAYVYLGNSTGGYNPTPYFDAAATYGDEFSSVNATALFGFSVAGVPRVRGFSSAPRIMVGAPSGALDFSNGLLNIGSTIGQLFNFTIGNNGLGKGYMFSFNGCAGEIPLPAYLTEFKGVKLNSSVQLTWTASTEYNVNFYRVERSIDGRNYEPIGIVLSKNESGTVYTFNDNAPVNATNYYRLQIVDNDEKSKYSTSVKVSFKDQSGNQILVSPNPVKSQFKVVFTGLTRGNYRLELKNTAGQTYIARSISINNHQHQELIPRTAGMASGIYYLNVYDENKILVKTVQVLFE